MLWLAFLVALASFVLIAKSADIIVVSALKLAHKMHVSDFNIGFFVLGVATSTPELFVGVNAAFNGHPQLSLGNLIGASIVLLSLIIGLNALISGEVHFLAAFNRRDVFLTSLMIFSPAFFLIDGTLSRLDGIFLLLLYVLFFLFMNRRQTFMEAVRDTLATSQNHVLWQIILIFFGVAGLFISSRAIVIAAEFIAVSLNLPFVVLGLVLVAIGTNLPEFSVLFKSIQIKHKQISIGDFLGSAAANAAILGFVAVISPITLEAPAKVFLSLGVFLTVLLTFNAFFLIDKKIHRLEGLALIALYGLFLFSEIFLKAAL